MHRLHDLAKMAKQGYWKQMWSPKELDMYCPEVQYVQDDIITNAYYFEDDEAEVFHPATMVLIGRNGIYVKGAHEKGAMMYKFLWIDMEAAWRYVKKVTKIV